MMKNNLFSSLSLRQAFYSLYNPDAKTEQAKKDATIINQKYEQAFHSDIQQDQKIYESSLLLNNQNKTLIDLQNEVLMNKEILSDMTNILGAELMSRVLGGEKNQNNHFDMASHKENIQSRIENLRVATENNVVPFNRKNNH
jgi:hypothetical protein